MANNRLRDAFGKEMEEGDVKLKFAERGPKDGPVTVRSAAACIVVHGTLPAGSSIVQTEDGGDAVMLENGLRLEPFLGWLVAKNGVPDLEANKSPLPHGFDMRTYKVQRVQIGAPDEN